MKRSIDKTGNDKGHGVPHHVTPIFVGCAIGVICAMFLFWFRHWIKNYFASLPRQAREQWPMILSMVNLDRGDLQSQV
jgi:hypothetical protein